ncbi:MULTISPECIES: formate dehydrogenase accessory sulfurtransferase FdhD [Sphingomonas]|uniref:Sulfur carrier protein FdhD n=1 Tax=Sphingomonas lycopersici TaxID=2951807 RepID=A0AA41ZDW8_9SPHN|nr:MULTISPECIES: formate dehydrogenase accessory sulfurtransferase FdhD [Sphingomonas]MCW6533938.1 formate dehydrogenase accessory sulfurtransferase FdhD [Sphingomonas lycopersici]OJU17092.1 MAG: formate dehydrogenase family accessory protein FdhD [Sphingomonas sp. 66-10]
MALDKLQAVNLAVRRVGFAEIGDAALLRTIPVEAPVSIEVCGVAYTVVMATPSDLRDYALGFALSDGLVDRADQIESIDIQRVDGGWAIRLSLPAERAERVFRRARRREAEGSCGLCGVGKVEQLLRSLPPVKAQISTDRLAIMRALAGFRDHQPLGHATGGSHAAAFCSPAGAILRVREDVDRHNALDKLIGALASDAIDPATGFYLLSARCSYELVEKAVRSGCSMLVTISAPTSLAVERAMRAGLTLVAIARTDSALIITDEQGSVE